MNLSLSTYAAAVLLLTATALGTDVHAQADKRPATGPVTERPHRGPARVTLPSGLRDMVNKTAPRTPVPHTTALHRIAAETSLEADELARASTAERHTGTLSGFGDAVHTAVEVESVNAFGAVNHPDAYAAPAEAAAAILVEDLGLRPVTSPEFDFDVVGSSVDRYGVRHIRLRQEYRGLRVHGGEVVLHTDAAGKASATGRLRAGFKEEVSTEPAFGAPAALSLAYAAAGGRKATGGASAQLLPADEAPELIIFLDGNRPRLAYVTTVHPDPARRIEYVLDAQTGEVLRETDEVCHLTHDLADDPAGGRERASARQEASLTPAGPVGAPAALSGPTTTRAVDLAGVTQTLQTYAEGGVTYLIDGSRAMFQRSSSVPTDVRGGILTLDARDSHPNQDDFGAYYITEAGGTIADASAVSAHFNAERSYEYFLETFGRNAISGDGASIIAVVNVTDEDGSPMDNAFWNGRAMFYGSGNVDFTALAESLDVGGHEMAHGVDQATSNLEYRDESGAIDESFADIYGAMIDRDDWKIGDDIVNPRVFRSGTMRDMADPHNGGSSLNDRGWQPAHYSERYTGSADNGGVHINSGIPNRAYYLIATAIGKDKAEQLYYNVQVNYLTRNSRFIDLRNGVQQATERIYGRGTPEWDAVVSAMDAVGMPGSAGGGGGTEEPDDQQVNPGSDFVAYTDAANRIITLADAAGTEVVRDITPDALPLSRPSVTDDGSLAVFVVADGRLSLTAIDYVGKSVDQRLFSFDLDQDGTSDLVNAAVSLDGTRLALLTDINGERDDYLYVASLTDDVTQAFRLYTPGSNGERIYNVRYADVIEFDYTGESILFDALSEVPTAGGGAYTTWDIGVVDVFDGSAGADFADGEVVSLFGIQREGTAVGNPTLSKNSGHVIAFDYFNEDGTYELYTANLLDGEVRSIWASEKLIWPSYTAKDDGMIFSLEYEGEDILGYVELAPDKLSRANDDAYVYARDAARGTAFANGRREIVSAIAELAAGAEWVLGPNPTTDVLHVFRKTGTPPATEPFRVFDVGGAEVLTAPADAREIDLSVLPKGAYLVQQGETTATVIRQ